MSINLALIIFIAVISFYANSQYDVKQKLLMHPYRVYSYKEYYRFITSGFVHSDMMHLFFNLFTLYFFGDVMVYYLTAIFGSKLIGGIAYIALFLLGVIISDIPTFSKHKLDPSYRSLGASGGVSSVVFASILYAPTQSICLYAILCLPAFIFGTLYLVYSFYEAKRGRGNINHSAHFYGAVFGIIYGIAVYPSSVPAFIEQLSNWNMFG